MNPVETALPGVKLIEPRVVGHDRRYAIDKPKARTKLGYAAARNFEQGFGATLAW